MVLDGEGEIGSCGMRMQTMRTWFIMADAEVAENVGFCDGDATKSHFSSDIR